MPVGGCECERVSQTLAHAQALHSGQAVVQGISIVARGVQGERAIEPDRVCLRKVTRDIVQIRVNRRGQRTADAGRIFKNGSRDRRHDGRVIAAVNVHGHNRGRRAAVVISHRYRKGVCQVFARA